MKIFRYRDLSYVNGFIPSNGIDPATILSWGTTLRSPRMPDAFAEMIVNWKIKHPSPNGHSMYDTIEKTWTVTPEGSRRVADHWEWYDERSGGVTCPVRTWPDVVNRKEGGWWSLGIFQNGKYDIAATVRQSNKGVQYLIRNAQIFLRSHPKFIELTTGVDSYIVQACMQIQQSLQK